MATTAIRNTESVAPARENRGTSKIRSIYRAIAHVLEPYFGPGDLEMLAARNRSKLTELDKAYYRVHMTGIMPF